MCGGKRTCEDLITDFIFSLFLKSIILDVNHLLGQIFGIKCYEQERERRECV